jgi:hypothetical protein
MSDKKNPPTYDPEPGKHASQTKKWYMSCDSGESVLVGMQEPNEWICPVLGLERYNISLADLVKLENASKITCGAAESAGSLWRCEEKVAREILKREPISGPFEAEEESYKDATPEEYGRDLIWCGTDHSTYNPANPEEERHTIIVIGGFRFE